MNMILSVSVLMLVMLNVNCGKIGLPTASDNMLGEPIVKRTAIKFEYNGEIVDEHIRASADDFVVKYEITSTEGMVVIVDDYNTYLRAFRNHGRDICAVDHFVPRRTFESAKEFADWETDTTRPMIKEEFEMLEYDNSTAIRTRDFLCQEARDVCEGLPLYWGFKQTDGFASDEESSPGSRPKRFVAPPPAVCRSGRESVA